MRLMHVSLVECDEVTPSQECESQADVLDARVTG
jgi:hypothetical protein